VGVGRGRRESANNANNTSTAVMSSSVIPTHPPQLDSGSVQAREIDHLLRHSPADHPAQSGR